MIFIICRASSRTILKLLLRQRPFTRTVSVSVKFTLCERRWMDLLMDRMGSVSILSIRQSVFIDVVIKFDGDGLYRSLLLLFSLRLQHSMLSHHFFLKDINYELWTMFHFYHRIKLRLILLSPSHFVLPL